MSLDDQFVDWLRGQTLDARAGRQDTLKQEEVTHLYRLWKLIASRVCQDIHYSVNGKSDVVIGINIVHEHEAKLMQVVEILGIKKVSIQRVYQDVTWISGNYVIRLIRLIGRRKDHLVEPIWIDFESLDDKPQLFDHQRDAIEMFEVYNERFPNLQNVGTSVDEIIELRNAVHQSGMTVSEFIDGIPDLDEAQRQVEGKVILSDGDQ